MEIIIQSYPAYACAEQITNISIPEHTASRLIPFNDNWLIELFSQLEQLFEKRVRKDAEHYVMKTKRYLISADA